MIDTPDIKDLKGWRKLINHIAYPIAQFLFRLGFRLTVRGARNLPKTGSALVASNHPTFLDPAMLYWATKTSVNRPIYFMAVSWLFDVPFIGECLPSFGVFPYDESKGGGAAMESLVANLQKNRLVGIFPEGNMSDEGPLMKRKLKTGVMRAAHQAGVPIIPMTVVGGFRTWPNHLGPASRFKKGKRRMWTYPRFKKTSIIIHPPMHLSPEDNNVEGWHKDLKILRSTIEGPLRRWFALNRPPERED